MQATVTVNRQSVKDVAMQQINQPTLHTCTTQQSTQRSENSGGLHPAVVLAQCINLSKPNNQLPQEGP